MNNKLIWFIFLFVFISCSQEKKPEDLIPEDKMIEILTGLHRTDAFLMQAVNQRMILANKTPAYYVGFFKKHDITRKQFDASFAYYSSDFHHFEKMYDQVIANLQKEQDTLGMEGRKRKKKLP